MVPFSSAALDLPASSAEVSAVLVAGGPRLFSGDEGAGMYALEDGRGPFLVVTDDAAVTFIRVTPTSPTWSRLNFSRHTRLPRFLGPVYEVVRGPRRSLTAQVDHLSSLFGERSRDVISEPVQ